MKISKLGMALVIINSMAVLIISYADTMDAIRCGSSGFALIPIMIIDFPASFFALLLGGFIQKLVPIPTVNTISVIHMDTIIRHTILAASILILGGMQWYCIGWFISKIKSKMKKQGIK